MTRSHRRERIKVLADRVACDLEFMCDAIWEPASIEGTSLHCKHGTGPQALRVLDQSRGLVTTFPPRRATLRVCPPLPSLRHARRVPGPPILIQSLATSAHGPKNRKWW